MGAEHGRKDNARKAVVDALNGLFAVSNGNHKERVDDELNGMMADVTVIKANAGRLGGRKMLADEPDFLADTCDEALQKMADVRARRIGVRLPAVIGENPDAAMLHEFLCADLLFSIDGEIVGGLDAFIPYSRPEEQGNPRQSRKSASAPAPKPAPPKPPAGKNGGRKG